MLQIKYWLLTLHSSSKLILSLFFKCPFKKVFTRGTIPRARDPHVNRSHRMLFFHIEPLLLEYAVFPFKIVGEGLAVRMGGTPILKY